MGQVLWKVLVQVLGNWLFKALVIFFNQTDSGCYLRFLEFVSELSRRVNMQKGALSQNF